MHSRGNARKGFWAAAGEGAAIEAVLQGTIVSGAIEKEAAAASFLPSVALTGAFSGVFGGAVGYVAGRRGARRLSDEIYSGEVHSRLSRFVSESGVADGPEADLMASRILSEDPSWISPDGTLLRSGDIPAGDAARALRPHLRASAN